MIHGNRKVNLTRIGQDRSDLPCEPHVNVFGVRNFRMDGTLVIVPSAIRWRSSDLVGGAGGGVQL